MDRVDAYTPDELRSRGWAIATSSVPDPVSGVVLSIPRTELLYAERNQDVVRFEIKGLTKPLDQYRIHLLKYTTARHRRILSYGMDYQRYKVKARVHPADGGQTFVTAEYGRWVHAEPGVNRDVATKHIIWSEFTLKEETPGGDTYVIYHPNQYDAASKSMMWRAMLSPFIAFVQVQSTPPGNLFYELHQTWGTYRRVTPVSAQGLWSMLLFKNIGFGLYDIGTRQYVSNDVVVDIYYETISYENGQVTTYIRSAAIGGERMFERK